jgi:hypothetical protein
MLRISGTRYLPGTLAPGMPDSRPQVPEGRPILWQSDRGFGDDVSRIAPTVPLQSVPEKPLYSFLHSRHPRQHVEHDRKVELLPAHAASRGEELVADGSGGNGNI